MFMSSFRGGDVSRSRIFANGVTMRLLVGLIALGFVNGAVAEVKVTDFGKTAEGKVIKEYTVTNDHGVVLKLLSRGATLAEWHVPDKDGKMDDVVFGFDDVAGYESKGNGYFGAT